MSVTSFATNNALVKKAWEEKLFRDWPKDSYFGQRFMGKGQNSIIQVTDKVEKGQGDKVTFGIRMRLTGAGQTGEGTLEGNEEALNTYDYSLTLEQYRHAVRYKNKLSKKRVMFNLSEEANQAIRDWGAEKIDQLIFDAAYASPSKVFYRDGSGNIAANASLATAKAALNGSNSKITPQFISAIRSWALTGGNYSQTPIRPVKVDGGEYLILLVHPDVMFDLKQDTTFNTARTYAQERGKDNPLFKNAIAIWDDVVIHENQKVNIAADGGGASVPWAQCLLMGAQALVWAWGERPEVIQKDFDYENEVGHSFGFIAKAGKPQFNGKDYGCINVALARTNVSGL
jgi:N4-gp56 family major capsid protein